MTQDGHMAPEEGHEVEQNFAVRSESRSERKKHEREERSFRLGALKVILGVLVLIVLLVLVIGGFRHYFGNKPEVVDTAETTASKEPIPVSNEADVADDFVIKQPPRAGNRLNSDGITISGDAEAFRKQIAEQAKHDPLTLYLYYMASPLGDKRPLVNESVIAKDGIIKDGNVYSERGVEAYNDWLFLWELADIEAVHEIRFQGANTGVDGARVTQSNGVGGSDKAGYDVVYRDVSGEVTKEHSALERCTQPTFSRPITWVPEGPTDCPPPKPPTKEVKGPNRYPDSVKTHQESVPVPGETPGYPEPNNAERVVQEQQKSYPGNRTSTPSGTDSGSTTNTSTNSQTTGSDGSKSDATIGNEVENTPTSGETVPSDEESGYDPYDVP